MQNDKETSNKMAMSRALGAAFLSHQVEQLEKSVGKDSRSARSANWRERGSSGRGGRRGGNPQQQLYQGGHKKERKENSRDERSGGRFKDQGELGGMKQSEEEKDADIVVVDSSVLVHALGQLKKWCRDGRREVILIPLEALNTLDLLKKGSTPLAQRARAASRLLEAQVGTNPRIRVQRDDAFVLWDEIPFTSVDEFPPLGDSKASSPPTYSPTLAPPPEWLRRTICCGRWELINASSPQAFRDAPVQAARLISASPPSRSLTPNSSNYRSSHSSERGAPAKDSDSDEKERLKVVIAVVASAVAATSSGSGSSLETSTLHPGRYERADGSLVRIWAKRAGIDVIDIEPIVTSSTYNSSSHQAPPEKRRPHNGNSGSERRDFREHKEERKGERRPSLVEKPIAMAIVNDRPVKALRVLARGEKLDP